MKIDREVTNLLLKRRSRRILSYFSCFLVETKLQGKLSNIYRAFVKIYPLEILKIPLFPKIMGLFDKSLLFATYIQILYLRSFFVEENDII